MSLAEKTSFQELQSLTASQVKQLAVELSKNPDAHQKLRELFTATERAAWQEEVIAGTPCEYEAASMNFKVIPRAGAEIKVTVSSNVRQVGKTALTTCIVQALKDKGYRNVELVPARQMDNCNYEYWNDEEHMAEHIAKNGDIKVIVQDEPLWHNKA